jgi:hypothetical protein
MRALLGFVLKLSPHRSQEKSLLLIKEGHRNPLRLFCNLGGLIIYIKSKIFVKEKILYIVAKTKDNHYLWE